MRKDDDVGSVEESEEEHDVQAGLSSPVCPSSPLVNIPAENTSVPIAQRQSSTHHSRGRGAKRTIVNSRSLVQAVTQQQKGSQHTKKASSRKC